MLFRSPTRVRAKTAMPSPPCSGYTCSVRQVPAVTEPGWDGRESPRGSPCGSRRWPSPVPRAHWHDEVKRLNRVDTTVGRRIIPPASPVGRYPERSRPGRFGTAPSNTPSFTTVRIDCGVEGGALVAVRVVEGLLGAFGMLAPWFGLLAVRRSRRSAALAASGRLQEARVAAEDSRDAVWYVVGFGLAVAEIGRAHV